MSPLSHSILQDRAAAGRRLIEPLLQYAHRPDVIILALPRGGVPVAYEVATALGVRLDLMLVRKLGVPSRPEYAMGAIASGGIQIRNEALRFHPIDKAAFQAVVDGKAASCCAESRLIAGRMRRCSSRIRW
jgi:putative phosphoribosyl transferase